MKKINDLQELLKHELEDLYSAETQLIDALPKMVDGANSPKLKKALSNHLKITNEQKKRLDKIQKLLNPNKKEKGFFASLFSSDEGEEHCKAMEGLIEEAETMMEEDMDPQVLDAAIIAAAQKIEHYEISSYGTAKAFAKQLGMNEIARLLETTLKEEYNADDSLTELALAEVNIVAEGEGATKKATKNAKEPVAKKTAKKAIVNRTKKVVPKKAAGKPKRKNG